MIQAINRMAGKSSFMPRDPGHHHSSPGHLGVPPPHFSGSAPLLGVPASQFTAHRSLTGPQRQHSNQFSSLPSSSRGNHTAPLDGANDSPYGRGYSLEERRTMDGRQRGGSYSDPHLQHNGSHDRSSERRPRGDLYREPYSQHGGSHERSSERRPHGDFHAEQHGGSHDRNYDRRPDLQYQHGGNRDRSSPHGDFHAEQYGGSRDRNPEQRPDLHYEHGGSHDRNYDGRPDLHSQHGGRLHGDYHNQLCSDYTTGTEYPPWSSEQPQSYPPISRRQDHKYSSLKDSGVSSHHGEPGPYSHTSSNSSPPSSHQSTLPPPSSSSYSAAHHEKVHHHYRVSAQTRSHSENSLPVPGTHHHQQPQQLRQMEGYRSQSQTSIPCPTSREPHPLSATHTSASPSPVHHPVNPDPLTTGGSSSPQRNSDPLTTGGSSSPQRSPHDSPQNFSEDPQTAGVSVPHSPRAPDPHTSHTPGLGERPRATARGCLSKATLENERYSLDAISRPDHDNEDRDFYRRESDYIVFGVFDGHDGSRASGFASTYMMTLFDMPSWRKILENPDPEIMRQVLNEFFKDTERAFFRSIQKSIDEKERLQKVIPQHLSSYQAYQQFPYEVSRLSELEPKLTGGCTAVLAILVKDRLYVANAGDSRALLVVQQPNGTLVAEQLTHDHSVESEEELRRLEALGLDPRQLIKAGRLGMHENTRSIGDYSIKQGYKEVDILSSARSPPGIATPYIMPTRAIDSRCKYLILMTDGVYKSIESTFETKESIDPNKLLLAALEREIGNHGGQFNKFTADAVLARVAKIHRDCYTNNSKKDPRSDLAVACRKRDDMTLLVYKFPDSEPQ